VDSGTRAVDPRRDLSGLVVHAKREKGEDEKRDDTQQHVRAFAQPQPRRSTRAPT